MEVVPFASIVNYSFWNKFTEIKLDIVRLSEDGTKIWGYFSNLGRPVPVTMIETDSTSFNTEYNAPNTYLPVHGTLYNKNTIENFKDCDKTLLIRDEGQKLLANILNGNAITNPSLLNVFFILSFADLKKYYYYYWFCFPTLANINIDIQSSCNISKDFDDKKVLKLHDRYKEMDVCKKSFFVVRKTQEDISVLTLETFLNVVDNVTTETNKFYYAFADPSHTEKSPGWPLRNYITFLLHYCKNLHGETVKFISFRLSKDGSAISCKTSTVFSILMPKSQSNLENLVTSGNCWFGWERNERSKFGPRLAKLKEHLDPLCISENAADLNLKLMKWRLLPDLDLDIIRRCKFLLLGAGTLGCSVARTLLGWGVRDINLVDNGNVSYSNPVRQSLYFCADAIKGLPKAETAAANLKNIFGAVNSKGYKISIPMPGHTVGENLIEETRNSVEAITDLIKESDIIFLLMDSRESRWLPTLLGAYHGKIVINSALGFDSYLVMRHGFKPQETDTSVPDVEHIEGLRCIPGEKLGCYFCNDVTAPGDSMKDRALDQQCTVSRPGLSPIAGALAVELAISVLQHKDKCRAPAYYKTYHSSDGIHEIEPKNQSLLGIIPHSIRGYISSFTQVLPATEKYKQCIACSDIVLQEYESRGFDFLLQVFNSSKHLEDLTGLTEICKGIAEEDIWDLNEDDDDSE